MKLDKINPHLIFNGIHHSLDGIFVVIEGMSGSGKTTITNNIFHKFKKLNYKIEKTCYPTKFVRDSVVFQKFVVNRIKSDTMFETLQLMHMVDRFQHDINFIIPNLKKGKIVICDRYIYSSIISILSYKARMFNWFVNLSKKCLLPDLAVYLDCSSNVCFERIMKRRRLFDYKCNLQEFIDGTNNYRLVAKINKLKFVNSESLSTAKTTNKIFNILVNLTTKKNRL